MKTIDEDEKWILNIISTLFYVVAATLSRVFNDEMIIYNIISLFISLIHFAISKNCFKKLSEICIAVLKLSFLYCLIILFFRSQILMYVYHSSKVRHSRFKHLIFLIMLMHFRNHLNFAFSWNFAQNINCFVASFNVYNNFVM